MPWWTGSCFQCKNHNVLPSLIMFNIFHTYNVADLCMWFISNHRNVARKIRFIALKGSWTGSYLLISISDISSGWERRWNEWEGWIHASGYHQYNCEYSHIFWPHLVNQVGQYVFAVLCVIESICLTSVWVIIPKVLGSGTSYLVYNTPARGTGSYWFASGRWPSWILRSMRTQRSLDCFWTFSSKLIGLSTSDLVPLIIVVEDRLAGSHYGFQGHCSQKNHRS